VRHAVRSLLRRLRGLPFTVGFATTLAAAEIGYCALSSRQVDRVAAWASTNVARLRTEPIGALRASVFVVGNYRPMWLVPGALGCALVQAQLGWRRTLLVALAAQLGGTAVAIGPNLLSGLTRLDVSPVGHLAAFVIGGIFIGVLVVRHNKQRRIQVRRCYEQSKYVPNVFRTRVSASTLAFRWLPSKPDSKLEHRAKGVRAQRGANVTTTYAASPLTATDRCDRCGAQAYVRATMTSGSELLFCAHHWHDNEPRLREIGATIHDESERLAAVPATAALEER
jgi:hypothetical protein